MFDEKELEKLSQLSRIRCTEEEKRVLVSNINRILSYFDQLQEIDTSGVSPCNQVVEGAANVMREDESGETLPRELFLSNAPAHIGGMIRVPPVMKPSTPS